MQMRGYMIALHGCITLFHYMLALPGCTVTLLREDMFANVLIIIIEALNLNQCLIK